MKFEATIATAAEGQKTASSKPKKSPAPGKTAKPARQKRSKVAATKKRVPKKDVPAAGKGEMRADTKKAIVLELLRRKQGATTAEIAKATDWQNHTIRGFISGNVTKKMNLTVESSKSDAGERTYRIVQ